MDLKQPWALDHLDARPAGAAGGGQKGSSGTGGTGSGWDSSGRAGASGTGGALSASGASSTSADAGMGGNTSSSSALDAKALGGNAGIDAPADFPQASGGVSTAGSGGSAGRIGGAGGSGTGFDAGAGSDARSGGSSGGGSGGVGGTVGQDGAAGQDGRSGAETRDAASPDTATPDAPCALCAIGTSLVHRYTFSGTGTTVTDSVGTAHGTVKNATLSGSGTLVLAGGTSDQYVDLPDHLLSTLTSATLEIWVTWTGGNSNQRILDFGDNEQSGSNYRAITTVIISPNSGPEGSAHLRASYSSDVSVGSTFVEATSTLATGSMQQITVVFDGRSHTMSMYVNGTSQGQATEVGALSAINDINVWLGKSQYTNDPGFGGTYHEFRIYNAALTAEQVKTVYAAGSNASFSH